MRAVALIRHGLLEVGSWCWRPCPWTARPPRWPLAASASGQSFSRPQIRPAANASPAPVSSLARTSRGGTCAPVPESSTYAPSRPSLIATCSTPRSCSQAAHSSGVCAPVMPRASVRLGQMASRWGRAGWRRCHARVVVHGSGRCGRRPRGPRSTGQRLAVGRASPARAMWTSLPVAASARSTSARISALAPGWQKRASPSLASSTPRPGSSRPNRHRARVEARASASRPGRSKRSSPRTQSAVGTPSFAIAYAVDSAQRRLRATDRPGRAARLGQFVDRRRMASARDARSQHRGCPGVIAARSYHPRRRSTPMRRSRGDRDPPFSDPCCPWPTRPAGPTRP